jgi:hypothetical protein
VILLAGLVSVADQLNALRESTMVYRLPSMVYPGAVVVSGIVRRTLRTTKRAA